MIEGPLTVIAGPGSGKTRMLTRRIAHLVLERRVPAAACLAVTFNPPGDEELRARLLALLPAQEARGVTVESFHSLGLSVLRAHGAPWTSPRFPHRHEAERKTALATALGISESRAARLVKAVSVLKRTGAPGEGEAGEALLVLERLAREEGWVDFDDLVVKAVDLLERELATRHSGRHASPISSPTSSRTWTSSNTASCACSPAEVAISA
jgi:superfamily I DNA/RNA helicase